MRINKPFLLFCLLLPATLFAQRQMEALGRGVVAVHMPGDSVF